MAQGYGIFPADFQRNSVRNGFLRESSSLPSESNAANQTRQSALYVTLPSSPQITLLYLPPCLF